MAYIKRDWNNTGNEVTKDDFNRIENGVEANDLEIANQKNATIPGTLANKIGVLNDTRGYLNTNILPSGTDLNTIWQNGIYQIDTNTAKNVPKVYGEAYVFVNGSNELYFTQRIIYLGGWEYYRSRLNDSFLPWNELATVEQIKVLSDDRGYLNTKALRDYDLNLLTANGLYYINNPINTPVPSNSNNNGYCEVIYSNAQGYYTQVFTQTVTGTKWCRVCSGGIWVSWQQIATTTKTSFSLTANTGFTITSQNCYVQNDKVYIRADIAGTYTANTRVQIASIPSSIPVSGINNLSASTNNNAGGLFQGFASCGLSGTNIFAITSIASSGIQINGVIG